MKIILEQKELREAIQDYIFKHAGETSYINYYTMVLNDGMSVDVDHVSIELNDR